MTEADWDTKDICDDCPVLIKRLAERDAEVERLRVHVVEVGKALGDDSPGDRPGERVEQLTTRLRLAEGLLGHLRTRYYDVRTQNAAFPTFTTSVWEQVNELLDKPNDSNKLGSADVRTTGASSSGVQDPGKACRSDDSTADRAWESALALIEDLKSKLVEERALVIQNRAEAIGQEMRADDAERDSAAPSEPSSEGEVHRCNCDPDGDTYCLKCYPPSAETGEIENDPTCGECGELVNVDPELEWNPGDVCWTCLAPALDAARKEIEGLKQGLVNAHDQQEVDGKAIAELRAEVEKLNRQDEPEPDDIDFITSLRSKVAELEEWKTRAQEAETQYHAQADRAAELEGKLEEAEKSAEMRCIKHAAYSSECPFCDAETSEAELAKRISLHEECKSEWTVERGLRRKADARCGELDAKLRGVEALRDENYSECVKQHRRAETAEAESTRLRDVLELDRDYHKTIGGQEGNAVLLANIRGSEQMIDAALAQPKDERTNP